MRTKVILFLIGCLVGVLLKNAFGQTNLPPPWSPPAPLLPEGMTYEQWTTNVEYTVTIVRTDSTNTYTKNTSMLTNHPPAPTEEQLLAGRRPAGHFRRNTYEPVYFTWHQMDELTGETNVIVTVETRNKSGFARQRISK